MGERWGEAVHEPAPGEEKCDFCSRLLGAEAWEYRCRPHEIATVISDRPMLPEGARITQEGPAPDGEPYATHHFDADGLWGACDGCHDLIEAGDRRGLADRGIDQPDVAALPLSQRLALRGMVAGAHRSFFEHRLPEPPTRRPTRR